MPRYLIILAVLLASCGSDPAINPVPADLLTSCSGHMGPVPRNEKQLALALLSEIQGRQCANRKIEAIAEIIGPQ